MKIFVKDDKILAAHDNNQDVESLYDYDFVYQTNNFVDIDFNKNFSEQFEYNIDDLEIYKTNKKEEIKNAFINSFDLGMESSIGMKVDCRRDTNNNDLQNFESLLKFMKNNDVTTTQIKLWDNSTSRLIIQSELEIIINEIIAHVIQLYNKKWQLETLIESATTKDEIKEIKWI